jgi:hypothetical protein
MRIAPHLRRPEHNLAVPDLDTTVLALFGRAGGPNFNSMRAMAAAPSLAELVRAHGASVMARRPSTPIEDADHE